VSAMNEPLTGHEPPAPAKKRRGLTIGHWLLIVIFVAVCVDIGIRILAYRKLQASVALRAAENRTTQQLLDTMRKNYERIDVLRSQSKKSMEDLERRRQQLERLPDRQDSSKGNIIPL
jgi:cell division protein FtsB